MEAQNEKQNAFKQAKVFTQKEQYFGIPSKVCYNVVAFAVGLGVAFKSPLIGLLFLGLLAAPLYHIHKDDPFALTVWKRGLFRQYGRWCAGRSDSRKIKIIEREDR